MFSDPEFDLTVSLIFLGLAFFIGLIFFVFTRKKLLSFIIFSVLGSLGFLINLESGMFIAYNIGWMKYVNFPIWPLINIILIIYYFKNKK